MCTSTVLDAEALPEQPEIAIVLSTVDRSGIATSVGFVPEQPGGVTTFTVSVYDAVCVADVQAPVTVTGYVPAGVDAEVLIVRAEDAPEVTDDGLKLAVAPLGRPLADRLTVCALPEVVAVATVADTEPPGSVAPEVGETDTEKSLAGTPPLFT